MSYVKHFISVIIWMAANEMLNCIALLVYYMFHIA